MKKNMIRAAALLAFAAFFAWTPAPAKAADFEELTFSQLETLVKVNKGKIVMINFFATWCPPCREEVPSLIRIREHYGKDRLLLIGASMDEDNDALKKYMAKAKINYPVKKAARDLVQAAGVGGIPHMLVFDGKGEVIGNAAGLVPEKDLRDFIDSHMESES